MKTSIVITTFFLFSFTTYSQNITNTLGTGGIYTIKDASTTFLTLQQTDGYLGLGTTPNEQLEITGNLRLPYTTSSSAGVIYKANVPFIHAFALAGTNGWNTFVGLLAGNFTMTGSVSTQGSFNTGVGAQTLVENTTGYDNTAIGYQSLNKNTSGSGNVAVGYTSLDNNTTGNSNTGIGGGSLGGNISGDGNTAIGSGSLSLSQTGFNNTALGSSAGATLWDGSNCTMIGYSAQPSSGSATNEITLGNSSVSTLRCNTQTITSLSDVRDKKNITDLILGLDFISKLKPRQFNWDKREWYDDNKSDGSKMQDVLTAGFIAQELDEVQTNYNAEWLNLVYKSNPEKLEATPGNLLPVIIKAVQELKKENDKLKAELESLLTIREDIFQLRKFVNETKSNEEKLTQVMFEDNQ